MMKTTFALALPVAVAFAAGGASAQSGNAGTR